MKVLISIICVVGISILISCSYKPATPMSQASKKHTAARSHITPSRQAPNQN